MRQGLRLAGLPLALVFALGLATGRLAGAGTGIIPPDYPQIGLPDAASANSLLDSFRQAGFANGDYFLEFDLIQMPRRGEERVFHGRLWGGRRGEGTDMRIALRDASNLEHRLLIQNGPRAAAWRVGAAGVQPVPEASLLDPLVPGVELTAFDLQMPYLYWPDVRVVSLNRVLGRPAYAFLFRPPAAFAAVHPDLAAVRAYIDTEFDRPLQIELIDRQGEVRKTFSVLIPKKIQGQWVLKEFDVRNEATRNKTRFDLTAAALGCDFGPGVLSPSGLGENPPVPAPGRLVPISD